MFPVFCGPEVSKEMRSFVAFRKNVLLSCFLHLIVAYLRELLLRKLIYHANFLIFRLPPSSEQHQLLLGESNRSESNLFWDLKKIDSFPPVPSLQAHFWHWWLRFPEMWHEVNFRSSFQNKCPPFFKVNMHSKITFIYVPRGRTLE